MNRVLVLLVAVVALVASSPALAARVLLEADTNELRAGQVSTISVTVVDASPDAPPRIDAPDGLEIRFSHSGQQIRQINFQVTRLVRFTYKLTALEPGDYTIGPVDVALPSGTMTTNEVRLRVTPRPTQESAPLTAEAGFLQDEAWEGQIVLYRYRLYARTRTLRTQWTLPEFEGLVAPRDGNRPRREYRLEDPSGTLGVDETYIPFLVTGRGDLTQPPAVVRVDVPATQQQRGPYVDPFGVFTRTRTEVLATEDAPLRVRELPPAPPGFSGLVGDFTFEGAFDRAEVAVGESVTWTVQASGDGALEGFSLPDAGELDGARVYDDSPIVGANVENETYVATGSFGRVIVPTQPGRLDLPPIEIVAFSPSEGRYVTHRIEAAPIQVLAGDEGAADVESFARRGQDGATPEARPRDIGEIRRSGPDRVFWLGGALPWILGAASAPGLVLVALTLAQGGAVRLAQRRLRRASDPAARLSRLPSDPDARLGALDAVLRQVSAGDLPAALDQRSRDLLAEIGRVRFGGEAAPPDLVERVRALVREIEEAR